jgi:hypothetical protein
MSDYALVGKKGTGKSSGAVRIMRDAMLKGRRVATNLNLHVDKLLPRDCRACPIRIPDKPTVRDLIALGSGNPGIWIAKDGQPHIGKDFNEDENGVLVLDEMGTWLNARSFSDPSRQPVLDWLVHARKFGWDVYYIMQHVNQVDKQLRESLIEYTVRFHRIDKIQFPLITPAIKLAKAGYSKGTLPKFHIGVMRMGVDPAGLVCSRMTFTGKDVREGYDTTQVFDDKYPHGAFSYLSHWHLEGYKHKAHVPLWIRATRGLISMFRPRVTADMPRNRKVVQAIFQRERNAERRQRLIEAQWRIERRQAKAARSLPLNAMRAATTSA